MKVPVTWEVCGYVDIDVNTMEEAMEYFREHEEDILLPEESEYVDGSFRLSSDDIESMEIMSRVQEKLCKRKEQKKSKKYNNIYIITNNTNTGSYTPSFTKSYDEAKEWLLECTADNIRAGYDGEDLYELEDEDVIEWARKNIDGFKFTGEYSLIIYKDGTEQWMEIYELDEI